LSAPPVITQSSGEITHYLGKISQPLLERIDICTEVPAVSFSKMKKKIAGESSAQIRKRVEAVQEIQREINTLQERLADLSKIMRDLP